MTQRTKILTTLFFLLALTVQAFAANLNTTSQWSYWQSDAASIQRLEYQARTYINQGTSSGYYRAANLYDQIGGIHNRNVSRFSSLASSTNDRAIAQQASYQARSRGIHARQAFSYAQGLRRTAGQLARSGR